MRWSWLAVCVAQLGIVASVGCGARTLDPGVPGEPGVPTGGSTGSSVGVRVPGQDAGPVTTVPLVDAWIAFDSDGGAFNRDIYVMRPDGTARRRLTIESSVDAQPSFSPDGTKLAFASDRDGGGVTQIYVMDLATGVATRVTQRTEGAHDPAFTIDGTRVGYRSDISVFTALLDGSDERQVSDGTTCCRNSPLGGPVFPSNIQATIYDDYNAIYAASDGAPRRTIVMPTTGEQSHPTVSPDGLTIALQATCINDNAARSIWTVPASETTPLSCTGGRRLSATATDATHPAWGPGNIIVWGSVAGGTNSSSPVPSAIVAWQDGGLIPLTSGTSDDRNPSWSPVGTVIGSW